MTDLPLETAIPAAAAPLESILCTEELHRRPSRPPDYEKENRALVNLASALADSPSTILQRLADTILDITQCDSAGLSLLTRDVGLIRFGGHLSKGEYDVQSDGRHIQAASAPPVH